MIKKLLTLGLLLLSVSTISAQTVAPTSTELPKVYYLSKSYGHPMDWSEGDTPKSELALGYPRYLEDGKYRVKVVEDGEPMIEDRLVTFYFHDLARTITEQEALSYHYTSMTQYIAEHSDFMEVRGEKVKNNPKGHELYLIIRTMNRNCQARYLKIKVDCFYVWDGAIFTTNIAPTPSPCPDGDNSPIDVPEPEL